MALVSHKANGFCVNAAGGALLNPPHPKSATPKPNFFLKLSLLEQVMTRVLTVPRASCTFSEGALLVRATWLPIEHSFYLQRPTRIRGKRAVSKRHKINAAQLFIFKKKILFLHDFDKIDVSFQKKKRCKLPKNRCTLHGVKAPCGGTLKHSKCTGQWDSGTEGQGQRALWDGWGLDLVIWEGFSNHNDSTSLSKEVLCYFTGGKHWKWHWKRL